jgi:hypothetical protein
MSLDERVNQPAKNDELQNLPERLVTDAGQVKGGATAPPGGPVPIPYPNVRPGVIRSIEPCL